MGVALVGSKPSDDQVGAGLRVLPYGYRVGKRFFKALQAWMDLVR